MIKIICKNSICEATFYFDEQRYPNAKEVKCPKCKNIQPLKIKPLPPNPQHQEMPKPPVPVEKPRLPIENLEDFFGHSPVQKEPNQPTVQPILSLIMGDWAFQRVFSLKEGKNFIGRRADNDIVSDQDEHISRRHAVLEVVATSNGNWQYLLYDIGNLGGTQSKNGVYIGSKRLNIMEQFHLISGNSFQLGDTKFKLK